MENTTDKLQKEDSLDVASAEETESSPSTESAEEKNPGGEELPTDYSEVEKADVAELKSTFPELEELNSITELKNPMRYAALRDLGLSPKEAYLATEETRRPARYNNRSHLVGAVPAQSYGNYLSMTKNELESARQIFGDLSDAELQRLYKKVTK